MKAVLMKLIYYLAEKGKMIGINRGKLRCKHCTFMMPYFKHSVD